MNIDKLPINIDTRGNLVPIYFSNLPFTPKRMFYVTNVPEQTKRGQHGHYKCCQYYICIKGIIQVEIHDGKEEYIIDITSGQGIFIDKMVWSSEKFVTDDTILLVLCSEEYDATDYFTDKQTINNK